MTRSRVIARARRFLARRFPWLKRLRDRARLVLWQWQFRRTAEREYRYSDLGPIQVPLSLITECVRRDYDKWKDRGQVLGGDWDRNRFPVEELYVMQSFREHFDGDRAWQETEYYQRNVELIARGESKWGCLSREHFDERCRFLDELYAEISTSGFKSQRELPGKSGTGYELFDEVSACIDRDGRFLFEDGRHRFCIAKLAGVESIPVQITVRHMNWHLFRQEILDYAKRHQGKVYAPLPHPDLADIPSVHNHSRFELLRDALPCAQGEVLDIGAHWGYFCHRFETLGFNCHAVEPATENRYFLERLKAALARQFTVIPKSVLDYTDTRRFDVVLALNIFHHFLKEERDCQGLAKLLGRLQARFMFFQPHLPEEPQMQGAYRNFPPDDFVDFILRHSAFDDAELLGTASDNRPVYLLRASSREREA